MKNKSSLIIGLVVAICFAFCATRLAVYLGISAALVALLLGVFLTLFINFVIKRSKLLASSVGVDFSWSERQGLGLAITLMGFQMPWSSLVSSGVEVLILVFSGLVFTFCVTYLLSKTFRLSDDQGLLMATGNGICGSAAVMATQSVLGSNKANTAMVVTLVNVLGLLGMFLTPSLVTYYFQDQDLLAGQFIGNTLQSMPHVVAAGFSVNGDVAQTAVWVKMVRILMLVPVLVLLSLWYQKAKKDQPNRGMKAFNLSLIPGFIWGFLLCALIVGVFALPVEYLEAIESMSDFLMYMTLVAIGAGIQWQKIRQSGGRLLAVGLLLFAMQLTFSGLLVANL